MNERTRKLLVFSVALIVVVWGYFNLFGPKKQSAKRDTAPVQTTASTRAQTTKVNPVNPGAVGTDKLRITEEMAKKYQSIEWGKDPFYHTTPKKKSHVVARKNIRLKLLGILYRELSPQALINNRVVGIGDDIGGYRVIEITDDYVKVSNHSETINLRVQKESS